MFLPNLIAAILNSRTLQKQLMTSNSSTSILILLSTSPFDLSTATKDTDYEEGLYVGFVGKISRQLAVVNSRTSRLLVSEDA